jgi:ketosteroid isomerase-like protein
VALACAPTRLLAATLKNADAKAVRAVIQAQLDAFAAGNATRAFAFATPGIRQQFGDANNFMAMVRTAYPMVVSPEAVTFFLAQQDSGAVRQMLRLRDRQGQLWLATYVLQRQANGKWLIDGCVVVADEEKSSA